MATLAFKELRKTGKQLQISVTLELFKDPVIYLWWNFSCKYSKGVIHLVRTYAYQKVRNFSFSENFAYVINEWSLNGRKLFSQNSLIICA